MAHYLYNLKTLNAPTVSEINMQQHIDTLKQHTPTAMLYMVKYAIYLKEQHIFCGHQQLTVWSFKFWAASTKHDNGTVSSRVTFVTFFFSKTAMFCQERGRVKCCLLSRIQSIFIISMAHNFFSIMMTNMSSYSHDRRVLCTCPYIMI